MCFFFIICLPGENDPLGCSPPFLQAYLMRNKGTGNDLFN